MPPHDDALLLFASQPPVASIFSLASLALVLLLLLHRWFSLGQIAARGWLGEQIARISRAARRQVFIEAGFGTCFTIVLLSTFLGSESLIRGNLAQAIQHAKAFSQDDPFQRLASILHNDPSRLSHPVLFATLILLLWTYIANAARRHEWFKTMKALDRPIYGNNLPAVGRAHEAVGFCSNSDLLRKKLFPNKTIELAELWCKHLLPSLCQASEHSLKARSQVERSQRVVWILEKLCRDTKEDLLVPLRMRTVFGGSRSALIVSFLAYVAGVGIALVVYDWQFPNVTP